MRAHEFTTSEDIRPNKPIKDFDQLDRYIAYLKPTEKFYRIHGNYCGPGNRGGQPADAIDSACRLHDVCYMINGYHDPVCDQELIDWVEDIDPRTLTKHQRSVRWAIIQWFANKLKYKTAR